MQEFLLINKLIQWSIKLLRLCGFGLNKSKQRSGSGKLDNCETLTVYFYFLYTVTQKPPSKMAACMKTKCAVRFLQRSFPEPPLGAKWLIFSCGCHLC